MTERPDGGKTIADSLADLAQAGLGLGAVLARAAAEAATGEAQTDDPEEPRIRAIVRHGATATGGFLRLATQAARSAASPQQDRDAQAAKASANRPRVRPGGSIRIQMSVENPSDTPMKDLRPCILTLEAAEPQPEDSGTPAVSLQPDTLTVAPHDFEKLSVLIEAPDTLGDSDWTAMLLIDEGLAPTPIAFQVRRADAAPPVDRP